MENFVESDHRPQLLGPAARGTVCGQDLTPFDHPPA